MMRIDKYLAEMGQGTRSEIKKLIRSGRVMVDGETVKKPELKIDETTQKVSLEGKQIGYAKKEYYMLYKPAGVISATKDDRDKTVLDLITDKKRNDLFPVGRLDKDTEGLLLITNDGELAHRLLSPKKHVDKVYYAKVQGKVDESDVKAFADGVDMGFNGGSVNNSSHAGFNSSVRNSSSVNSADFGKTAVTGTNSNRFGGNKTPGQKGDARVDNKNTAGGRNAANTARNTAVSGGKKNNPGAQKYSGKFTGTKISGAKGAKNTAWKPDKSFSHNPVGKRFGQTDTPPETKPEKAVENEPKQ